MKTKKAFFLVPYLAWIILFVFLPILLILWYSFTDSSHSFTLSNYVTFFKNGTFLKMMINSFWYAFLITLITLLISYPAAYFLTKMKNQQLWLLLIILPTWINLLLKAYAFIGILGNNG
ncbi:MAG: ABC transporter permease, partial [Lactobacillus sp.]|nr:ABC transporter permease [Lactobacillus sp.]